MHNTNNISYKYNNFNKLHDTNVDSESIHSKKNKSLLILQNTLWLLKIMWLLKITITFKFWLILLEHNSSHISVFSPSSPRNKCNNDDSLKSCYNYWVLHWHHCKVLCTLFLFRILFWLLPLLLPAIYMKRSGTGIISQ